MMSWFLKFPREGSFHDILGCDDSFLDLGGDYSYFRRLLYLMSGTMPQAIGPVNLGFDRCVSDY